MADLITKSWDPEVASEFLNYIAADIDNITGERILELLDYFRSEGY